MKLYIKKCLSLLLGLILLVAALAPAVPSEAASIRYKAVSYGYYSSIKKSNTATIEINGLTKDQRITAGSVSSSDTKVGKVIGYTRHSVKSATTKVDSKSKASSRASYSYSIRVKLYSVGTTIISYNIDGTDYQTTLYVNEFTSPAKTIKISGINSSKNIAANVSFNTGSGKASFASVTKKSAKFTITPEDGWRVISMAYDNESTGYTYSKYTSSSTKTLKSISLGTLNKKYDYSITATFADSYGNTVKMTIRLDAGGSSVQ